MLPIARKKKQCIETHSEMTEVAQLIDKNFSNYKYAQWFKGTHEDDKKGSIQKGAKWKFGHVNYIGKFFNLLDVINKLHTAEEQIRELEDRQRPEKKEKNKQRVSVTRETISSDIMKGGGRS